jgi:hypothetical protein
VAQESELNLIRTCSTCVCMHVACMAYVLYYVRTSMHTMQCSTEMHIIAYAILIEGSVTPNPICNCNHFKSARVTGSNWLECSRATSQLHL